MTKYIPSEASCQDLSIGYIIWMSRINHKPLFCIFNTLFDIFNNFFDKLNTIIIINICQKKQCLRLFYYCILFYQSTLPSFQSIAPIFFFLPFPYKCSFFDVLFLCIRHNQINNNIKSSRP
jgi:hypothetical protein